MTRDELGICLSRDMLVNHLESTFTCIRAYRAEADTDDIHIQLEYAQMKGRDVLVSMKGKRKLTWRADFICPNLK
ncbi:hypothetical protein [Vibrio quintilis]|uniref:Uncharacterized protein n=1 Tax=Vibrio quintilis TaxID=1117707 RepID=A0A1M7YUD3_9VIBR|nr:hypothetical protein [Vibrio quintilis]SHO56161.1 hypothetical protein VQ7734_01928 [Vibrio quintilis]